MSGQAGNGIDAGGRRAWLDPRESGARLREVLDDAAQRDTRRQDAKKGSLARRLSARMEAGPVPLHERLTQRGLDALDLFVERRLRHLYCLAAVRALGHRL